MANPTIKDVAREAGVSIATVSRVLNKKGTVKEESVQSVLQAIERLGYHPNSIARTLKNDSSKTIGLVVTDISNDFFTRMARGIEDVLNDRGYNLFVCSTDGLQQREAQCLSLLREKQVDGIILANSHSDAPRWIQQYAPHLPTVLLGTPASLSGDEVNSVCIDNLAGGRLAAEYLLSLGHRSIAYLGHRSGSLTHQLRLRGFMEVLGKEGLTPTVIENTADSSSIGAGYELSRKLFNEGCPHTAIFAATDSLALGAMQAADEFGISIPDDLSLLGFDNIIYSSLPKITLSTIDQRKSLLAEAAVDILTQIIESDERDEFTHRMIRPALIRRSSCASIVD